MTVFRIPQVWCVQPKVGFARNFAVEVKASTIPDSPLLKDPCITLVNSARPQELGKIYCGDHLTRNGNAIAVTNCCACGGTTFGITALHAIDTHSNDTCAADAKVELAVVSPRTDAALLRVRDSKHLQWCTHMNNRTPGRLPQFKTWDAIVSILEKLDSNVSAYRHAYLSPTGLGKLKSVTTAMRGARNLVYENVIVIESDSDVAFAYKGDSGSLCWIWYEEERLPIGMLIQGEVSRSKGLYYAIRLDAVN